MNDNPEDRMTERPMRGVTQRFNVAGYTFERYSFRPSKRWGCVRHGRGVDMCRTPVGAFFAQRRWAKQSVRPS